MAITVYIIFVLIASALSAYIESADLLLGQDLGNGLSDYRRLVLNENARYVRAHNSDPTKTWKLHLYPMFAALTPEQVTQKFLSPFMGKMIEETKKIGLDGIKPAPILPQIAQNLKGVIEKVDLRIKYGTYVKNQGACGNCYAYATVDAINMFFRKMNINSQAQLSIQQLTDCSKNLIGAGFNNGCNGGWYYASYIYAAVIGLTTESYYPYSFNTINSGLEQICRSSNGPVFKIDKPSFFPDNEGQPVYGASCNSRLPYLRNGSAISVAMYASNTDFYNYKSGVYGDCKYPIINNKTVAYVNHAVVLVGFQKSTVDTENYLILKNSWGASWGQSGHFRIHNPQANPSNSSKCLICHYGYLPLP